MPARVVRERFSPSVAQRMQALAWWDWSHAQLRAALDDFRALSAEASSKDTSPRAAPLLWWTVTELT